MTISEYVVDCLSESGLTHGFFMIGGALGPLADAFTRKKFRLYTMHHEQAAAFAAEAQAITTNGLGLALATSGPGATNLVTGIGSAFFSSAPVVFITGQVNRSESNSTGKRRQVGFQETDIVSISAPITKYAVRVDEPEKIAYHVEKALFLAKSGRMGPVLLDLPFDVQRADVRLEDIPRFLGSAEHRALSPQGKMNDSVLDECAALVRDAKRPVLLVGQGVRRSNAGEKATALAQAAGMPVVSSMLGTDVMPGDHPLYYGFIGTYAQRYSNFALANSDLVLVLGSRLDSRQVGVDAAKFAPMAKIIHVDIDETELGASVREHHSIKSDVGAFIDALMPRLGAAPDRAEWITFLNGLRAAFPRVEQRLGGDEIEPVNAIRLASSMSREGDAVAVDVGLNQVWFAQGWRVKRGQEILTNGGMGPMGYALPAAIGASVSRRNSSAWIVTGDGGMQVNIQELQTVRRHCLPIKMIVLNNRALGMLVQFQTENFEGRLTGSVDGYDTPDFVKIAEAYGIPATRAGKRSDLEGKIAWLAAQKGPALLEVEIPRGYFALPKAVFSKPVHDMKPFLEREEYRKALAFVDDEKME